LPESSYGTHSLNLRAVQLLLGHTKIDSTMKYLGVEVEDALALSEIIKLRLVLTGRYIDEATT